MAQAEIGVIGGSGLYSVPGLESVEDVSLDTPWGAPSDKYMLGTLQGKRIAFLARHGRGHRILPSDMNFRANIYGFRMLGVERIISFSAVGSLKEEHTPLSFVLPDQFYDRTRQRRSTFFGRRLGGSRLLCRSGLPRAAQRFGRGLPGCGCGCHSRRHLSLHGGSCVLHQGGIQRLPVLGNGRDWDDQPAGGQGWRGRLSSVTSQWRW